MVCLPLPHRPLSDLVWVMDRYLVFDRWSTPHYGIHYVLDAPEQRLILAVPFADSLFLESQRPDGRNCAAFPATTAVLYNPAGGKW